MMQLNLTLGVDSLENSAVFYRELLGLRVEEAVSAEGCLSALIMTCGEIKVVFLPLQQLEAQHPALLQNVSQYPRGAGVQLEFTCDNLSDIVLRLEQAAVPISYELEDRQFGRHEIWVQDPDGYLLILNQEPA